MKQNIGKELISWEWSKEESLNRIRAVRGILGVSYIFSSIFLFIKIYSETENKVWAFVTLSILTLFFIWIFYFYRPKYNIYYIIGEKGIIIRKKKEKFYSWDRLKGYYNTSDFLGNKDGEEINSSLGKIFCLMLKNSLLDWGQILIVCEKENSVQVETILKKNLKYTKRSNALWFFIGVFTGLIVIILIFLSI